VPAGLTSVPRASPDTWPDHESFVRRYVTFSGPPDPPATVEVEPRLESRLQPEILVDSSQERPSLDVKAELGPGSLLQEETLLAPSSPTRGPQRSSEVAHLSTPSLGSLTPTAVPGLPLDVKANLGPGSLLHDEMLLSFLLGTRDMLRLSEATTWLVPYRYQLGEIVLTRWWMGRWGESQTAVMLLMQRRLHIIRLSLVELNGRKDILALHESMEGRCGSSTR
jgi:hypothetical protein